MATEEEEEEQVIVQLQAPKIHVEEADSPKEKRDIKRKRAPRPKLASSRSVSPADPEIKKPDVELKAESPITEARI
jgi:hypothetical protein